VSERRIHILGQAGLERFLSLRSEAVETVTARFYETFPSLLVQFGERGRKMTRDDLTYHLEFMRPVLEFGILEPFTDYLQWLAGVLESRNVSAGHLPLSLDWIREFFDLHLPVEEAEIVGGVLKAAKSELLESTKTATFQLRGMPEAWDECAEFEDLLLAGDRTKALALFRRCCESKGGFLATSLHLVQPALYGIGQRWQENRISVAREHLASSIAHEILTREYARVPLTPGSNRKVVLACVEENQHALGLVMIADAFELSGWEVCNLGANTPTRALVDLVAETQPDVVCLSVSLPFHYPAAREAIDSLRARLGKDCSRIMLGGLAINQFIPLADVLGSDASAVNAKESVRVAEEMVCPR
jgi:MerR family transcriptional regulator, light-induced transcriptional regulator